MSEEQTALDEAQAAHDAVRDERAALIDEEVTFAADIKSRKQEVTARFIQTEDALIAAQEAALDAEGRDKPADTVIGG